MQLFLAAFQSVPDPRAENVRHNLAELLIIAFVAVLCGAQGCAEMAEFGRMKLEFFKRFRSFAMASRRTTRSRRCSACSTRRPSMPRSVS